MRLLVLGPTGVVGAEVVREALHDARFTTVMAISRRPLAVTHPRLETLLHADFRDFTDLRSRFSGVDAAICALGMAWPQADSEAQYRAVTNDYVMALARTLNAANPEVRFCFVSGHGASATSRQTWARIKAETEDALRDTFGSRLVVFRPGYIYPVHGRETGYWGDTVMRPFMPFRRLLGRYITDSVTVARALLYAALGAAVASPAGNPQIEAASATYAVPRTHEVSSA
ncbi:MAG: epimerase [Acidobacteria bacterium]|nr:MAG: epimerase [Acidobacteriota bacterium]